MAGVCVPGLYLGDSGIYISHRSVTVTKLLGSSPVAVLATLFLLSYAKILRTIIAVLSLTILHYPHKNVASGLDPRCKCASSKVHPTCSGSTAVLAFPLPPIHHAASPGPVATA